MEDFKRGDRVRWKKGKLPEMVVYDYDFDTGGNMVWCKWLDDDAKITGGLFPREDLQKIN